MAIFDNSFKEILTSQFVSIFGGLVAGGLLAIYKKDLLIVPGMLILIPGFLEMRGNISGTFAARLSSGLFLGIIKPTRRHTKLIKGNLIASFFLAIITSVALGLIAFAFNRLVFGIYTPKIILVPIFAGILANAIEIPMTMSATFFLFKRGHDPNNIMGPFVTSTGDVTSVMALLIAMLIL
jgi:mgtE-like transporter